ncbi:nuclear transport factor 2 family protein [Actinoplanes sp. NPDC020271]|uniref:nuclear transport factor 2 family protein n=1 Tax=Actinoplanes sp. NPDC020271 TaxID=3363896 RepID=UPI0037B2C640
MQLFEDIYAAFNRRDVPAVLERMTTDVTWPKAFEGGTVRGRDEVAAYWRRQWTEIDPEVTPVGYATEPDGRVAVTVAQVVRDLGGKVLAESTVTHVYRLDGELVAGMEIR